jgi:vacuolar-type H+-ATPase subunit C/Vma6
MTYDYGNARIAARRAQLLTPRDHELLADTGSAAGVLAQLERRPTWASAIGSIRSMAGEPDTMLELAIERLRAHELAALPTWYEGQARVLAEVLVVSVDHERIIAIMRRQRAGERAATIVPRIVGGALLDAGRLTTLAHQPTPAHAFALLARWEILDADRAAALTGRAKELGPDAVERAVREALDGTRSARVSGRGANPDRVRTALAEEAAERSAVRDELEANGPAAATLVERSLRRQRLARQARAGRRDPSGIGCVIGHVADVEAQAIALRTTLARVTAGWTRRMGRGFLGEPGA